MQYRKDYVLMETTIFDRLKTAGLDNFIPKDLRVTNSGEFYDQDTEIPEEYEAYMPGITYGGCHDSARDRLWAERKSEEEEEDRYLYDVKAAAYRDKDEEEEIEGKYDPDHEEDEERPETLYDLKEMFHFEDMPDEDFISLKVSDLFRVTDNELKFLDDELINQMSLDRFIDLMTDERTAGKIPSPEKRIKYCQIEAVTDTRGWASKLLPYRSQAQDEQQNDLYSLAEEEGNTWFKDKIYSIYRGQIVPGSDIDRFTDKLILNQKPERALDLLGIYSDYLSMYMYALYRNVEHEADVDTRNRYPLCPKVSHLKDLHDKAMRDYNEVMSRIQSIEHDRTNEKIAMQIKTPDYKRFLYKADGFMVTAPQKLEDLQEEGRILNHCVASYISPVADGRTKIYFIRKESSPGTPFYTAEVKQDDTGTGQRWCLTQCYTENDSTRKDKKTRQFINKWCREKNITIKCRV